VIKKAIEEGQDFTHVLPLFRDLVIESGIKKDGHLIFAGCPGPCFSMATFFGFGIRDLGLKFFFAVDADMEQLLRLEYVENQGITAAGKESPLKADVIVLMSGLCNLPLEKTLEFINNGLRDKGVIIGEAPAHGLFEEMGWIDKVPFNFLFEFSMHNPTSFSME
jgi:hypothetical protein